MILTLLIKWQSNDVYIPHSYYFLFSSILLRVVICCCCINDYLCMYVTVCFMSISNFKFLITHSIHYTILWMITSFVTFYFILFFFCFDHCCIVFFHLILLILHQFIQLYVLFLMLFVFFFFLWWMHFIWTYPYNWNSKK